MNAADAAPPPDLQARIGSVRERIILLRRTYPQADIQQLWLRDNRDTRHHATRWTYFRRICAEVDEFYRDEEHGACTVGINERLFPVLGRDRLHRTGIAWVLISKHERFAIINHGQTLERLAARGGLSLDELAAVLEHRPWRSMTAAQALAAIRAIENSPP